MGCLSETKSTAKFTRSMGGLREGYGRVGSWDLNRHSLTKRSNDSAMIERERGCCVISNSLRRVCAHYIHICVCTLHTHMCVHMTYTCVCAHHDALQNRTRPPTPSCLSARRRRLPLHLARLFLSLSLSLSLTHTHLVCVCVCVCARARVCVQCDTKTHPLSHTILPLGASQLTRP